MILIVPSASLRSDGVAHGIVGGEKSEARIEQVGRGRLRSAQCRRDGEGARLGLGIGAKRRLRHIASTGCIADDMDTWSELRFERHRIDRAPTRLIRQPRSLRQFAGDLRRDDIGDAGVEGTVRRPNQSAFSRQPT